MSKKSLLLYHANCPDGFGAAYAFWKKYNDLIDYKAVSHGDSIPEDIDGRDIWMADFCFSRDKMEEIVSRALSVTVIDHHITSMEAMADYQDPKYEGNFIIGESGAALCWKYLNPGEEVPVMIKYIQDRDVNTWELPNAREFLAVLDSQEMTFKSWEDFALDAENQRGFERIVKSGKILLDFIRKNTDSIKENIFTLNIRGVNFPTVNTALFWRSDILNEIAAENEGYSAGFNYDGEKFSFSLRSMDGDKLDVSEIAKSFPEGGGHKCAAGFRVLSLKELNYT